MPDHFQQLPESSDQPAPNVVAFTGLPIFSTEKLTAAERKKLTELQAVYRDAALAIELALRIDRVSEALDVMQSLSRAVDGMPSEVARMLGSNR